jgi:acyl-CoA thioesterase-1
MIAVDMWKRLLILCLTVTPMLAAAKSTVLVFGDSLSAGYGIAINQSWPSLLADRMRSQQPVVVVANASVSGETTAGGRSRLPAALERFQPAVVVLALGANDGLRGLPLTQMQANLIAMIRTAKEMKARVLLVGMKIPPNYGPDYTSGFEATFAKVAKQEKIDLVPFLLAPIALDQEAFQADGLHPTAAAQVRILDHLWPAIKAQIK